jgi:hypothetical protein
VGGRERRDRSGVDDHPAAGHDVVDLSNVQPCQARCSGAVDPRSGAVDVAQPEKVAGMRTQAAEQHLDERFLPRSLQQRVGLALGRDRRRCLARDPWRAERPATVRRVDGQVVG